MLAILLCHELGHYLLCRRYRLPATLPYFLPAPIGLGTFGAFIRIRGADPQQAELFDVGVAGSDRRLRRPAALPDLRRRALRAGGRVPHPRELGGHVPLSSRQEPALLGPRLAVPRPAAGVGDPEPASRSRSPPGSACFATMLNLLPLAQLDGGHSSTPSSAGASAAWPWPLWLASWQAGFSGRAGSCGARSCSGMGLRHPPVLDEAEPLDRRGEGSPWPRLAIFVLCFMPVPISQIAIGLP